MVWFGAIWMIKLQWSGSDRRSWPAHAPPHAHYCARCVRSHALSGTHVHAYHFGPPANFAYSKTSRAVTRLWRERVRVCCRSALQWNGRMERRPPGAHDTVLVARAARFGWVPKVETKTKQGNAIQHHHRVVTIASACAMHAYRNLTIKEAKDVWN